MRYNNISRTLFGYKLVYIDSYGAKTREFKLPKTSPFKLRPADKGGFCFVNKDNEPTQAFYSADSLADVFTCTTKNNTYVQVNILNGLITPEYAFELGEHIVTLDGQVFRVDAYANVYRTPYLAPLAPTGSVANNKISENEYVFKSPSGKYVLLDSNMQHVIGMEFNSPLIRHTFDIGALRTYTVGNKHYFCDKSGAVLKSIDSNLEIHTFNIHNSTDNLTRFSVYDRNSNSSIVYAYDETANKIKVETTLNNRVTDRYLDNRRVLYTTENENGKLGVVTRLDKNVIPHIYDSISKEQLKTRYLSSFRVVSDSIFKVGISADGARKYGAYDMEGNSILPTKYANIDLSESAKMADGTYRFMVSSVSDYYGVVDSKSNTLVPLKYIHFPSAKTIVPQKTGKGTSIERLVLSRPNGQKAYFNIFAENILASEEEKRSIVTTYSTTNQSNQYESKPTSSITNHSTLDDGMGD